MTDRSALRPRRSALFLPASNARAIEKARSLPTDVVILDLEDAVAPDAKDAAREAAVAAALAGGFGARELVVRVNGAGTRWHAADLAAVAGAPFDAVLLPKVSDADAIRAAAIELGGTPIWAMIETCEAVLRLAEIAAAPGLAALVLGFNDLAREMRARPGRDRAVFQPVLTAAVVAGRAHALTVFDAVCNALDDPDRLTAECAQARATGCCGKTLIHPSQIAPCNAAFSPDAAEIAWARRIIAAFADPTQAGAIRVEGQMVEGLHLEEARRIVATATWDEAAPASP